MLSLLRSSSTNLRLRPDPTSRNPIRLASTTSTGLYGFHHLKAPRGFQRFVDDAIQRSGELVDLISGMPTSADIIKAMDEISNTVCCVVDSAELCRHTHPNREFVEEANKASMRINEYLHYLNTNHTLFDAVRKAEGESHLLSKEGKRAAHYLRLDFERGGIHLPEEKLNRVNELNIRISQLCREFSENIVLDPGAVDIYPASRMPQSLHHLLKPIYRPRSSTARGLSGHSGTMKEKGFCIPTDPHTLSSVLQCASDSEVRKLAYIEGNLIPHANLGVLDNLIATRHELAQVRKLAYIEGNLIPHANLGVLDNLIATRHELAQVMGYRSYAEFTVKPNMSSSAEVVMCFLKELSRMVRPGADEEFEKIKAFKRDKCGQTDGDLEPWDESYYTAKMKSSAYDFDSAVVASYFPLPQCIEGLKMLVESLFGATFRSVHMEPGESWHPDVLKMSIYHPEEGDLGHLYLDLYSRKDKYPGCAHFAIKGGRSVSETEYQLPAVALVCNFSSSRNSSIVRLNHWELETLFHEFGHALHSLLSRTEYQHFSGTRVVFDLAETPSNLFEYYAWDYRVLKKFAKHYSTGEIIPEKLVDSMQGARKMFAATDLQRQVFYAAVDQTLFGEQPSPSTSSIVKDLKREYTSWKHVEGTNWQARFVHLLNYGAGYYSYLYAKCFAATIWQKLCQEDPLSLATGTALRTRFLQHGGAKEPDDLLNSLVGDGILRQYNGGLVPDITCLCNEMKIPGNS